MKTLMVKTQRCLFDEHDDRYHSSNITYHNTLIIFAIVSLNTVGMESKEKEFYLCCYDFSGAGELSYDERCSFSARL